MIEVLNVFQELNNELISLLKSLQAEDWNKETCLKGRTVKDLASHLIDTSLRRLAMGRDNYFGETPTDFSHEGLVEFIQDQNIRWISATKRLSPQILIGLLETSGQEMLDYFSELNPYGEALFPVDWAGEDLSLNWFDIAREYTEKWHHQMQIREALGREDKLYQKKFFDPIILTFIQAIPYTFNKYVEENFTLEIEISGDSGNTYYIEKTDGKTIFTDKIQCSNKVTISQEEFWKLVTNSKDKADISISVEGDQKLGKHLLTMVCVMS